jgi:chromosome partitioning protein
LFFVSVFLLPTKQEVWFFGKARNHERKKMKTIVLASQKGGAGKTTLAAHLAVAAEIAGEGPCVLMDTDPQGSLAAWWNGRKDEYPKFAPVTLMDLPEKLELLSAAGFAYAFIDTPPAITESISSVIAQANFVLIPTRPSPHDLRAVGQTVEMAVKANRSFAFAVTQAKTNSRLTVQAMAALSTHGVVAPAIIHDRVDFAASMIDGRTVLEVDSRGRSSEEVVELWKFIKTRINESTIAR